MASYIDLMEGVLALERKRINQSNKNLVSNAPAVSFGHIFSKSLKDVEERNAVPQRNLISQRNILELDLSLPTDDEAKFKKALAFVLEKEGSKLVLEDGGSRESSKLGILQSTARGLGYRGNIKSITRDEAEKIYKKLWAQSGAASLPFPLATVHFDAYVNNPASSKKFLEKSKGDIGTYLQLREQRYVRLASAKPDVFGKYLQGWKNRIQSLQTMAAAHIKASRLAENVNYPVKNG